MQFISIYRGSRDKINAIRVAIKTFAAETVLHAPFSPLRDGFNRAHLSKMLDFLRFRLERSFKYLNLYDTHAPQR